MKKIDNNNQQPDLKAKRKKVSRRAFLTGAGSIGAAVGAMTGLTTGLLSGMSSYASAETNDAQPGKRVINELPIPAEVEAPNTTEYQCDILVIGGGYAGLNAAVAAKKAGKSVLLVDKGSPGYSGQSPFVSSFRWFDKEFGDDAQAYKNCILQGGEYFANMDWFQIWIDESKEAYKRLLDWEMLTQFPKASKAGDYADKQDFAGYHEKFANYDRRAKFAKVLNSNHIKYVEHTMITDVIEQSGKINGAIGFHVPSGTIITFNAKAVVMCMGGGVYKPSGFPVGGVTFDGEYIAYKLGLPIIGKEFDDFHQTLSYAPGNAFLNNSWTYLENIWLCGGDITSNNAIAQAITRSRNMVLSRITKTLSGLGNNDGTEMEILAKADPTRKGGTLSKNLDDLRKGKDNDPMPRGDVWGAAVGMHAHLTAGIFCGLQDLVGYTGMPGLYVAGDGISGSVATGATYPNGVGFTSCFCSIQGWRAGEAAASYADKVTSASIPADKLSNLTRSIQAPMTLKTGLDPNWARDVLHGIMAPYWIHIVKSEKSLRSALVQVEIMRDEVAPRLMAASSHDLRLCHEMKHKILSAEMKLRAGLERRESRGLHYRSDYPYRDDKNFLCYIAAQKGKDGSMKLSRIDIKNEWKGDLNQDYAKRYSWRFPGETEAKGLPEEKKNSDGRGDKK